ncbi:membrane-bound lytic murein transglycosylase B [Aquipseudomonas alcaligenes]|uniref:lytic murein transglycosylase n=1 Tax=Aquipseudomonas alcaligenes TaxID=43263 RepID=UPI000953B547|nr:lytic murein transglycosylase [Pseudomonas alcaligenes]SIS22967.1 membrane-bound lytic murein transglycosylase B [Pseudomonas alcaligenes]
MFQLSTNGRLSCLLAGAMLFLGACAETPNPAPELVAATPTQPPKNQQNPAQAQTAAPVAPALNFADWRERFRAKALQAGIQPQVFDQAFAGVTPDLSVVKADGAQPEFTRPVWEYLDGAISPLRVRKGQTLLAEHAATLEAIEQRYGVDRETLVAIWGMESSFGQFMGEQSVIRSLATLAYEGRRPRFAEDQLLAALQILQSGDISSSGLRGSWAGAMGQTQFIPTTYLTHAVDFDGDGRRDIWNSSADALASAAHYLQASGWQKGRAWGIQVALPSGFDYALADTEVRKTYAEWYAHGVKGTPTNVDPNDTGYLLLPAGHRGPAFLVFRNFGAILKYNNSSSYALAVGLLGQRLDGGGPLLASWPKDERPLGRSERIELQEGLAARGYEPGPADGIIGANTRRAVRAFQQSLGLPADGYPTPALLQQLR